METLTTEQLLLERIRQLEQDNKRLQQADREREEKLQQTEQDNKRLQQADREREEKLQEAEQKVEETALREQKNNRILFFHLDQTKGATDIASLVALIDSLDFNADDVHVDLSLLTANYHTKSRKDSGDFLEHKFAEKSSYRASLPPDGIIEMSSFRRDKLSPTQHNALYPEMSRIVLNKTSTETALANHFFSGDHAALQGFVETQASTLSKLRRVCAFVRQREMINEIQHLQPMATLFFQGLLSELAQSSPAIAAAYPTAIPVNDALLSFPVHDRENGKTFQVNGFSDIALTQTKADIFSPGLLAVLCELKVPFTTLQGGKSFKAQKDQLMAELTGLATISGLAAWGMLTDLFSLTVMHCAPNNASSPLAAARDTSYNVQIITTVVEAEEYVLNLLVMLNASLGHSLTGIITDIKIGERFFDEDDDKGDDKGEGEGDGDGEGEGEGDGDGKDDASCDENIDNQGSKRRKTQESSKGGEKRILSLTEQELEKKKKEQEHIERQVVVLRFDSHREEQRAFYEEQLEEMRRWRSRVVFKDAIYLENCQLEKCAQCSPMDRFLAAH